jgi:hypothetical protein
MTAVENGLEMTALDSSVPSRMTKRGVAHGNGINAVKIY